MPKTRAAKAPPAEGGAAPDLPAAKSSASRSRRPAAAPEVAPQPVVEPVSIEAIVYPPASVLKKKALVDAVAAATGAKRKQVKDVVEATLAEIGAALSRRDEVVLPPLGRARVVRSSGDLEGGTLTVKLRRGGGKGGKEGLAEPDEAD